MRMTSMTAFTFSSAFPYAHFPVIPLTLGGNCTLRSPRITMQSFLGIVFSSFTKDASVSEVEGFVLAECGK